MNPSNPKPKIQNPKQFPMSNDQTPKHLCFGHWDLGFVLDFELWILDFDFPPLNLFFSKHSLEDGIHMLHMHIDTENLL